MLPATDEEKGWISDYVRSEARRKVTFLQKVHVETLHGVRHEIWDVHCGRQRWWVVTNPAFLYSQTMFPNIDLVLTFHLGMCLRMPRSEQAPLSDLRIEPFVECFRLIAEASDALKQAEEVSGYQAIGVRCREALLAFVAVSQTVMPWTSTASQPKKADLRAWADHLCTVALGGQSHKDRRKLMKPLLILAWDFSSWLTHTQSSTWYDAEIAYSMTEQAINLWVSIIIRHIRRVPEACPACGSHRLLPERANPPEAPDITFERPVCQKCRWIGEPVLVNEIPEAPAKRRGAPEGECVIPTVPLRALRKQPKAKRLR